MLLAANLSRLQFDPALRMVQLIALPSQETWQHENGARCVHQTTRLTYAVVSCLATWLRHSP
jgi:hypothetical protein